MLFIWPQQLVYSSSAQLIIVGGGRRGEKKKRKKKKHQCSISKQKMLTLAYSKEHFSMQPLSYLGDSGYLFLLLVISSVKNIILIMSAQSAVLHVQAHFHQFELCLSHCDTNSMRHQTFKSTQDTEVRQFCPSTLLALECNCVCHSPHN